MFSIGIVAGGYSDSAPPSAVEVEVATLTSASVVGPTVSQEETQGARICTLSAASVVGPSVSQEATQGARIGTLAAAVVIGPV